MPATRASPEAGALTRGPARIASWKAIAATVSEARGERWCNCIRQPRITSKYGPQRPLYTSRTLFDSLSVVQPGIILCPPPPVGPDGTSEGPNVTLSFYGGVVLAQATVTDDCGYNGECNPIGFSLAGQRLDPLVGNVIAPLQKLLGVSFGKAEGLSETP